MATPLNDSPLAHAAARVMTQWEDEQVAEAAEKLHAEEAISLGLPITASPMTIKLIREKRAMDASRPASAAVLITKRVVPLAESEPDEPDLGNVKHEWSKNDLVTFVLQPLVDKIRAKIADPLHARIIALEAEAKALKATLAQMETKALRADERLARHAEHLGRLETKTQALRK